MNRGKKKGRGCYAPARLRCLKRTVQRCPGQGGMVAKGRDPLEDPGRALNGAASHELQYQNDQQNYYEHSYD